MATSLKSYRSELLKCETIDEGFLKRMIYLGLQRGDLLLHILFALLLFLQHLPQVVLLFLHLPQACGEGQLLASLLLEQLLGLREGKHTI